MQKHKNKMVEKKEHPITDVSSAIDPAVDAGTFVTDKRRRKWSFGKAVGEAMGKWVDETTKNVKEIELFKETKKSLVAAPLTRKEVVKAAINAGEYIPKDDHKTVIEKLKNHAKTQKIVSKPLVLKPRKKKGLPEWSYATSQNKEPEIFEKPPESVAADAVKRWGGDVKVPEPVTPIQEVFTEKPPTQSAAPESAEKIQETIERPQETNVSTPTQQSQKVAAPLESVPVRIAPKRNIPANQHSSPTPVSKNTNQLVLIVIVAIAIIGGIGTGVFIFTGKSDPNVIAEEQVVITSYVSTTDQLPISLNTNKSIFIQNLLGTIEASSESIIQVYPTIEGRPATADEIFAVINPNVFDAFVRTLEDEMMIGSVTTSEKVPFIILKSYSFDNAFVGMIEWEDSIISDFEPFFGSVLTSEATFIDSSLQNHSVRTLTDADGNVRLIYGFIDRETIVITETSEVMQFLIDSI